MAEVDGHPVPLEILAENDGLTVEDFKAWFAPAFDAAEKKYPQLASLASALTLDFAIIHFTKRRYLYFGFATGTLLPGMVQTNNKISIWDTKR